MTGRQATKGRGTPGVPVGSRFPGRCHGGPAAGALATALLVLTALAAGCSSGHSPAGGAVQPPSASQSDLDMVSFTRCMRAHGVQVSDPYHRPGSSGLSTDLPPQDAATRSAWTACNHFIARLEQAKLAGAEAMTASRLAALTRYAECMRSHDITMLDPTAQGVPSLGGVPGMANNDFGRDSPQFRSADAACRHLLPAGITDDGSGP